MALAACIGGVARAAGPSLVYSPSDIPALRKKVQSEEYHENWKALLQKAGDFCDPSSPAYYAPERVDKDFDQYAVDIRADMAGRKLGQCLQDLGLAFHLTGEKKYKEQGVRLLMAIAETYTLQHPYIVKGFSAGKGDIMRALAMGYDQFGEFLTPEQKKIFFETTESYVKDFPIEFENPKTGWVPYHNFMGVNAGAAGLLALQLAEVDPKLSKNSVARIAAVLKLWLEQGFDKQGAYYEGVDYSTYGLDNATIFADALKRAGGEDLFQHPTMKRLLDFFVMSTLPGEKNTDARNDSDYGPVGYLTLKYGAEYKDGRGKWLYAPREDLGLFFLPLIWEGREAPVSPEKFGTPLAKYFEGRGLCIWRTGWQKGDVMFSVECGRYYPVTHNQADKGQITLYGYGYRWICDAGYACNREPQGRCQTIAHNCILVDGRGQSISGAGIGNNGKVLKYENNDVYGYALTDATEAYRENIDRTGTAEEIRANPHLKMDHALRHCIFLRPSHGAPAYAVALDNISQDGKKHAYTWQILSWPDLDIGVTGQGTAAVAPKPEVEKEKGPGKMFVFLDAASPPALSSSFYDGGEGKTPLPRLQAVCQAVNPYFASVLIPTGGTVKAPEVKFEQTPEVTTIRVNWPHRSDTVVWKKAGKARPEITVAESFSSSKPR